MFEELGMPKRAAVIERPETRREQFPTGSAFGEYRSAYLLKILEDIADSVRAGHYEADEREGVLVDTVVAGTRCMLLVHQPVLLAQLSPREQEIASMVANGRTNQAIAGALDISIWTVSTHLRRMFAKLGVRSRAEMVAHLLGRREFHWPS